MKRLEYVDGEIIYLQDLARKINELIDEMARLRLDMLILERDKND